MATTLDRGPELATIVSVSLGLAAVAVALRCYTRIYILKIFRIEDWCAILALVSSIAFTYFVLVSVQSGAGLHTSDVPQSNIPKVLQARWAGELTYVVTSMLLKLTIGIFLLRICSRIWHRAVIWTVLAASFVFNLFYFFVAAFQCKPVAYFWLQYTTDMVGSCVSFDLAESSTYAAVGVNAATDWTLGLLPIALVWNLDLNRKSKISLAGILALGSIASAATIVRIFYVYQLRQAGDLLWEFTDLAIWSTIENGLGLTASSIATLRPLFRSLTDPEATPYTAIKRASNSLRFHCRGPSADSIPYTERDSYSMNPYPQPGTAKTMYYRQSDSSTLSSSSLGWGWRKHSWMSWSSYGTSTYRNSHESGESHLTGSLHRGSTLPNYTKRPFRAGWHSDGSRRYYQIANGRPSGDNPFEGPRVVPTRPARSYSISGRLGV